MVSFRSVGKCHVCTGAEKGLFRKRITVTRLPRAVNAADYLLHPLVVFTKAGTTWNADVRPFLNSITLGTSGVASIDAVTALFLTWAHAQTLETRSLPWPGRSKEHVLDWAANQRWAAPGSGLGANGALCLARAAANKSVNAKELLATAAPQTRAFFVLILGVPASILVSKLPKSSPSHFFAPELWILQGTAKLYKQIEAADPSIVVPKDANRRQTVSALVRFCRTHSDVLMRDGAVEVTTPIVYARHSALISVNNSSHATPFTYAQTTVGCFVFWTRAILVVKALQDCSAKITMWPSIYDSKIDQERHMPHASLYAAESVQWAELYHLMFEKKINPILLCGNTASAIRCNGGAWLDLLTMPEVEVVQTGLAAPPGASINTNVRSAMAEDILLRAHNGCVPAAGLARIHSPAPLRGVSLKALRAMSTS